MNSGILNKIHVLLLTSTLLFATTAKAEGDLSWLPGLAEGIAGPAFGFAGIAAGEQTALQNAYLAAGTASIYSSLANDMAQLQIGAGLWSTKYTINGMLASLQDSNATKIALNQGVLDFAASSSLAAYKFGQLTRSYSSYFINKAFESDMLNLQLQSRVANAAIMANAAANGVDTSQHINSAFGQLQGAGTLSITGASSPFDGSTAYGARPAATNRLLQSATAKRTFNGTALPVNRLAAGSSRRTFATGRSLTVPVSRSVSQGIPHNRFHSESGHSGHSHSGSSGHRRPSSNSIYQ